MKTQIFLKPALVAASLAASTVLMAQTTAPSTAANDTTATSAVTAPVIKKWTCAADGLAEFRYDGSGWAFIRLSAYQTGHQYRVTKDETGDVAKGATQDRTPFVCTNK
jgi:hypothetical protein